MTLRRCVCDGRDLPFECGLNLKTGKVTDYSNAPNQYDEPEGIFPDRRHTHVECNRHMAKSEGIQEVDIYKLVLDGSGAIERITYSADYPGYKASNPVVSDDGRRRSRPADS